jgi:Domain of unknown function (DUF5615)
MLALYFDEDSMSRALVAALRARGVDVLTALEADRIERPDEEHLEYATSQGRVLCSYNVADFNRLHTIYLQTARTHAGLILVRQQLYSIGEQMRRLLRLMAARSPEAMRNRVEFLSTWS